MTFNSVTLKNTEPQKIYHIFQQTNNIKSQQIK